MSMVDATPLKSELVSAATLPVDPMADLIKQINEAHQEVRLALRRTGECAIKAGLLLLQAKKLVRHGSFAEWIAANCALSERTAQLYMQVARKFPNPQSFADFSLSDLMEMLGPAKLPAIKDDLPKTKVDAVAAAIKKSSALAVLEKAWDKTSDNERKLFLSRVRAA
jgi:hypothetical protein